MSDVRGEAVGEFEISEGEIIFYVDDKFRNIHKNTEYISGDLYISPLDSSQRYEAQVNALLAIVEKQREALSMVVNRPNGMWYGIDDACEAAVALTPENCKLVEVGYVAYSPLAGLVARFRIDSQVNVKDKLYKIEVTE